jgi:hypothetical protein
MKKLLLLLFVLVSFCAHSQTLKAIPDTFTVLQANVDTFYVTNNDSIPAGDSICITLIDTSTRFSVLSCHAIIYQPDSAFIGRDTCRYALCDTAGICDTAMVVIYLDSNWSLLLPTVSFIQDSSSLLINNVWSMPQSTNLFNCILSYAPACLQYRLINTSLNLDSIAWTVITIGYNFADTIFYSKMDTILIEPSGLPSHGVISKIIVCLTGYNNYGSVTICDTSCQINYCEGITEVPLSNIKIYPSPADKVLTIDMSKNNDPISSNYASIILYNSMGQKVRGILRHNKSKVEEISVTDLPDGIYMSTIIDDRGQEMVLGKFLVVK